MGKRKRSCKICYWLIFAFLVHVSCVSANPLLRRRSVRRSSASAERVFHDEKPDFNSNSVEHLARDGGGSGSSEFTLISPLGLVNQEDDNQTPRPYRRVVRRKRKKGPLTTASPNVITSVTLMPKVGSGEMSERITSVPIYEAPPKVKRYRKRGHSTHKVPDVWRVQHFNFEQGVDEPPSVLDKRESAEKVVSSSDWNKNFSQYKDNSQDLHYDESYHPFVNASTPISNELQNSLQFSLQILHPLLNSDTVLSDKLPKLPENKTVAVTHTLSDSVAQTPVAPDIGFLPTHLRKRHPLLNQDAIFNGESSNGASKTGVRTNNDMKPSVKTTTPSPSSTSTSSTSPDTTSRSTTTSTKPTTSRTRVATRFTPRVTTSVTTTTPLTTTTTAVTTSTTQKTSSTPISTTTKTTTTTTSSRPTTTKATTTRTTTTTAKVFTTKVPSSTVPTTSKSTPSKTVLSPEPFDFDHVLGILNITELDAVNHKKDYPTSTHKAPTSSYKDDVSMRPPIIMFPLDEKEITPITSTTTSSTTTTSKAPSKRPADLQIPSTTTKGSEASPELSPSDQLLLQEIFGGNNATKGEADSGEQLLELFNTLLQAQIPSTTSSTIKQVVPPQPTNLKTINSLQDQTNALLQNILLSSLSGGSNHGNLLNPFNLNPNTTPPNPSTPSTTRNPLQIPKNLKKETGLSDADLKSIFELLEEHVPSTSTTQATSTTRVTTTTTPKPTTVTTTTRKPIPVTAHTPSTTLHPALQSMLDLFANQLKPFQSIPPQPGGGLLGTSSVRSAITIPTTPRPPTTTLLPTLFSSSTLNSLDLLSQLLSLGAGGVNKVNPVRSTPPPSPFLSLASIFNNQLQQPPTKAPDFSLASIFGKNNIFSSTFPSVPQVAKPILTLPPLPVVKQQSQQHIDSSAPSESNQLLSIFGTSHHPTTPVPPKGLYYWLDLNAFLGGDRANQEGMAGVRPKVGNRFPFIKIN